jgi:hypothetical protein
LVFYRTPIATPAASEPEPEKPRDRSVNSEADIFSRAAAPKLRVPEVAPTEIYGSVSLADVLSSIKSILVNAADGDRVILTADDIRLVGIEDGMDRVKTLGDFKVEIKVKGQDEVIETTIQVLAEEAVAED